MPFSTSCSTPLSNFEAGQNYKDVVDPAGSLYFFLYLSCWNIMSIHPMISVHIGFRLDENPNRLMVAWTTTPWTLPSNLALAVHPELEYVVAKGLYIYFFHPMTRKTIGFSNHSSCSVMK